MLLPIGHEETTVRRMPWVTLAFISFCLLAFTLTAIAPSGEEGIAASERRAVEYFLDHPFLELDQRLKGYIYYSLRPQVGQEVSPPDDLDRLQRKQLELDALVEAFYTARDSTPYFRWGLVPTQQRPISWLTHMLMHAVLPVTGIRLV